MCWMMERDAILCMDRKKRGGAEACGCATKRPESLAASGQRAVPKDAKCHAAQSIVCARGEGEPHFGYER